MARKRLWLVPPATALDSRVDRGQLSRAADLDLARRAVLSGSFSILTFPIVVFGPSYFTDHPRVVIAAGVCLLGVVSLGLYLSRCIESRPKLALSTIVLSGSYWGLFYGVTIWLYGVDHWITVKFTICAVAIRSAATTSLAANLSIMRVFLILLLAPMSCWPLPTPG